MTEDNYRPLGPGPRIMRPYTIGQNPTIKISFTQSHHHLLSLTFKELKFQALNHGVPDPPRRNLPAFSSFRPQVSRAHLHVQGYCHVPYEESQEQI